MSSSDGFCSTLAFAPGELGQIYTHPISSNPTTHPPISHHHTLSASSSSNSTPLATPTNTASPSLTRPTPVPAPGLNGGPGRAGSPARSSSASSIQTLQTSQPGNVVNNPTPTLGTVPLVTATNSLPLTTPPQTPLPGVSHSATSSFSSTVLGKRDIGAASESEKEEAKRENVETEKPAKKRRIAPTLVSKDSASLTNEQVEQKPEVPPSSEKSEFAPPAQKVEEAENADQPAAQ